jgi:cytochrome c
MRVHAILVGVAVAAVQVPTQSFAAGDIMAGKSIFNRCKACHDAAGETNKVGPHLVKIVGRAAGSTAGFAYSETMKAKGAEGLIWTEENIAAYIKAPKEFVPNNKMAFSGLRKDEDIANLIEYLKADPKP